MNKEKLTLIEEMKKIYEEEHCSYYDQWPLFEERYQFLSLIGKGGYGEVYKGFDLHDLKEIACKVHKINLQWTKLARENYVKHVNREVCTTKLLFHSNIVKQYDCFSINENEICTVLEFCEGPDLHYYLRKHKMLSEKEAKAILKQMVQGLKYLHQNKPKIIHYDLKPQNILFHQGLVKITDFGLCKLMPDDRTKMELSCQGVGTYWYLPPETFRNDSRPDINTKVDIWALGVIFYEMLYGKKPFGNNMSQEKIFNEQVILKSNYVEFPLKTGVSDEAKKFIKNCLQYDPSARWDIQQAADSNYLAKNNNF